MALRLNTAYCAEIMATIFVIEYASSRALNCLSLECDSMLVVTLFHNDKLEPSWVLRNRCINCRLLAASMNFLVSHTFVTYEVIITNS